MSGSVLANRVRRGFYLDSVALMRLSTSLSEKEGVESTSLMIGSPSNLEILEEAGLLTKEGRGAGPDDLVLAVRATGRAALDSALDEAAEALERAAEPDATSEQRFPGLRSACDALPGANLALVSVPGPYAAAEARRALRLGLNVLLFSDHVPVEEEVALKLEARGRGLMVMGPDCGTAIIGGVPLAFANRVRRGDIGVIGASGTGLQEFSVLVHRGGGGISHGIGVGGRDLGDEVGAESTLAALVALETDDDTRHIAILSKPPGPRTEAVLLARLADCPKPVTLCLVGRSEMELPENAHLASTLRDAAWHALGHGASDHAAVQAASGPLPPVRPGRIVGLYTGGTLCAEAQAILRRAGVEAMSNAPIPGISRAPRVEPGENGIPAGSSNHLLLDLGADEYTTGRPHPMIEPAMRFPALAQALADPGVAVVLLDCVLGTGSHPDPAGAVVRALESTPENRPVLVASVSIASAALMRSTPRSPSARLAFFSRSSRVERSLTLRVSLSSLPMITASTWPPSTRASSSVIAGRLSVDPDSPGSSSTATSSRSDSSACAKILRRWASRDSALMACSAVLTRIYPIPLRRSILPSFVNLSRDSIRTAVPLVKRANA